MSVKKMFISLMMITFCISLCAPISLAANTPILLQGYAWEDNIDVFISGDLETDNIQFIVSKQAGEVTDSGRLVDKGVTIRTTILLDISTSMPQYMRQRVI